MQPPKPSTRPASLTLLALAVFGIVLSGCQTVPLDPEGKMQAVFQFGAFNMLVNQHSPETTQAVQAAFKQLDIYETAAQINPYDARLEGRTRDDRKILVLVSETNRDQTLVRIRVGEGGNLERSKQIFAAIEANLK